MENVHDWRLNPYFFLGGSYTKIPNHQVPALNSATLEYFSLWFEGRMDGATLDRHFLKLVWWQHIIGICKRSQMQNRSSMKNRYCGLWIVPYLGRWFLIFRSRIDLQFLQNGDVLIIQLEPQEPGYLVKEGRRHYPVTGIPGWKGLSLSHVFFSTLRSLLTYQKFSWFLQHGLVCDQCLVRS